MNTKASSLSVIDHDMINVNVFTQEMVDVPGIVEKKVAGLLNVFLRARGKEMLMHGSADTAVVTLRLFLTLPVGSCWMRRLHTVMS